MHFYKTMGELAKLIDEHFTNTEQCKLEYDYDSKYDTLTLRIIDGDEVKFNAELDIYNVGYRTSSMGLFPYETNRWFYSQWEQFKRNTFYGPIEQTSIELGGAVVIADPCSNLDGDDDIIELDNVKPGRWLVEARPINTAEHGDAHGDVILWHESVTHPVSFELSEVSTDVDSFRTGVYDAEHFKNIKKTDSDERSEKWCEKIVTTKPNDLLRSPITPLQRKYLEQAREKMSAFKGSPFDLNPEVDQLLRAYRMDFLSLSDERYYNDEYKMWSDPKSVVVQTSDIWPYQTLVAKDKGQIVAIKLELENPAEVLDEDEEEDW